MPWVAVHARSGIQASLPAMPLRALHRAFHDILAWDEIEGVGTWIRRDITVDTTEPDPESTPGTHPPATTDKVHIYYEILAGPEVQGEGWHVRKSYWSPVGDVQFLHIHCMQGIYVASACTFDVYSP